MRILLKVVGTMLVAYAVTAAMGLSLWGVSYGIRGIPTVHNGLTLVGTLIMSGIAAAAIGGTMLAAASDLLAKEKREV